MITVSPSPLQPEDWQKQLAQAISDPVELLKRLSLPETLLEGAQSAATLFPLRITEHYVGLIRPGDPNDPLLRQVLPIDAEHQQLPGFVSDPVGDTNASLGSGVLHKYQGRALLITTGACAIHCRYCFRRHYPYGDDNAIRHWQGMLETLRTHPDIDEVILSGGDPLSLSDSRLQNLLEQLQEIPHLKRLRLHTRLPVVLPARITPRLIDMLGGTRFSVSMVLHCNHPSELSEHLHSPLKRLHAAGVVLLNQAVLLAGVNDQLSTQIALSERLFDFRVLPYYLHLLDPVAGAAHFAVKDSLPEEIESGMLAALPGYLVPKLVREVPGSGSKTPIHRLP